MKKITTKNIFRLLIAGVFLWLGGSFLASTFAVKSYHKNIPPASDYFSGLVENQTIMTFDRVKVSAWFLPNPSSKKAVIILSGIGANRLSAIARAKFYQEKNYNVLLPDLRGTGESGGDVISFGWKERFDLHACVGFLEKKGMEKIAVHGMSLGAATIAYSFEEKPDYDFVVLESCYDNITNALKNRVERLPFPWIFYSVMTKFTELRIEATQAELRPEDYMRFCKCPTFIMAGDAEKKVKKEETEKIFANCAAKTKQLHFFKGAYHQDLMKKDEAQWLREMEKWLTLKNLKNH